MSLLDVEVVQARPDVAVAEFRGEYDLASRDAVDDLLTKLVFSNTAVVVDLSEAEFIDSSFVHCLVKADRLARERGARLTLQLGEALSVSAALEHTGVLGLVSHARNREEAMGGS